MPTADRTESPIMEFFTYSHLPENVQLPSRLIYDIARKMHDSLPQDCPERMAGLRKLLEAKDCFVRSTLRSQKPNE